MIFIIVQTVYKQLQFFSCHSNKKNIGGGIAAPLFSAVGLIWLGRKLKQKAAQKARAAMSFLLFSLNFK